MSQDYNKQAKRFDLLAVRSILCPPSAERTCDMNTKILGVKNKYALLLLLALGLTAAGPAMAVCNVTLSAILPGNQAVLKADCGTANMTEITWFSNGQALPGFPFTFAATQADLTFTATLTGGNQSYTASGFADGTPNTPSSGTPVAAGKAAIISLANLVLTVAGVWEQRLTREEAWELAEALDAVATRSPGNRPDESRS